MSLPSRLADTVSTRIRVTGDESRQARVLPSPARRGDPALAKAWVHPEVPTLAPRPRHTG